MGAYGGDSCVSDLDRKGGPSTYDEACGTVRIRTMVKLAATLLLVFQWLDGDVLYLCQCGDLFLVRRRGSTVSVESTRRHGAGGTLQQRAGAGLRRCILAY